MNTLFYAKKTGKDMTEIFSLRFLIDLLLFASCYIWL